MSICFNFQAPPGPRKWAFMEYLKILIFCALLANYHLRAFHSAIVHDAFVCREGTEPPMQTDRCRQAGEGWVTWQRSRRGCAGIPDGYWPCRELVRRG